MRIALAVALALSSYASFADEGQWQPYQMPSIADKLKESGITIPAKQLADLSQYPMNAVVGLGYCTASFVSPKGLVVTNHHCAFRAIQYNSSAEHDYMNEGFLARSMDKEPSAGPNERLYVTEEVKDVTKEVTDALPDAALARYQMIEDRSKALVKSCESSDDYRCSVRSFHDGLEYYLIKQLIIRDVRLVYAPAESIGAFGGDIDNYEFPRHSGDFSFLRAYVGKDGQPAPYSEDNVPYQPKSFLTINGNGVKAGDGVFVAGYPGRTSRYKLPSELKFASEWEYPQQASRYQARIDTITEMGNADKALEIRYAGTMASMANRMKKLNGLLDGFHKTDILGIREQQQQAFIDWLKQQKNDNALQQINALEQLLNQQQQAYQQEFFFDNVSSSTLLDTAIRLYRLAKEQQKPDAEREPGYQARDLDMFASRLKRIDSSFAPSVDKQLWLMDIEAYTQQDARIAAFDQWLAAQDTTDLPQLVEQLYQRSELTDQAKRLAWMQQSPAAFEQSDDPFIQLAVKLYDTNMQLEQQHKQLAGELSIARPAYMAAIIAYNKAQGKPVYPDANGTLRISYGTVDGYQSRDAVYKQPFTRVEGILEKNTGVAPYNSPQKLLDAIKERRFGEHLVQSVYPDNRSWLCRLFSCDAAPEQFNSVPVDFLSSVDTTGGNSGSPVFNGNGELVGLNFDSTYEAITKDWFFNTSITRAVHVDIRYILWMMDEVDHADSLKQELTITSQN
ncbi:S46 family peptidase [Shewanella sp. C32]|uniref:S46 family peptidase n=1 Tax=Shewanella electrica TaxID=515560 RepID=A0ABT2FQ55_9GAMM|nr:S46 family peptidase [Shewanella electrica]MCH1925659.1 S46 family peptidase [Shewanella electrica]MCS4558092.1 S46 family peptidase [Shewanella electrica]